MPFTKSIQNFLLVNKQTGAHPGKLPVCCTGLSGKEEKNTHKGCLNCSKADLKQPVHMEGISKIIQIEEILHTSLLRDLLPA